MSFLQSFNIILLFLVDLLSSKTFPSFGVSLLTDGNLGVGGFGEGYYFCSNQV